MISLMENAFFSAKTTFLETKRTLSRVTLVAVICFCAVGIPQFGLLMCVTAHRGGGGVMG